MRYCFIGHSITQKGLVKVNENSAKASYDVKLGDQIEIKTFNRLLSVKVLEVPAKKQVSKRAAKDLFEVLSDKTIEDDIFND